MRIRQHWILPIIFVVIIVVSGCTGLAPMFESEQASDGLRFEGVTDSSGIKYNTTGTGSGNGNSGVYAKDFNNDGWTDILVIGGESPELFINKGGEFAHSKSFPDLTLDIKSAAVVDYDEDGWDDILLFVVQGEPVALHNEQGEFKRTYLGLENLTYPLGGTVEDYDGDGDRDLFVYQSGRWSQHKPKGYYNISGRLADDNGNSNILFENTEGGFKKVTNSGINGKHWSLAASFIDLNGDGYPDIHVANDYNNDSVYINEGDGTFRKRTLGGSTARNGMSSEVADVNSDGAPDIFVTNIYLPLEENKNQMSEQRYERLERLFSHIIKSERTKGNTLLLNQGNGTFTDRADKYGVRGGGWGWAASLTDFDNDGDRDLVHTTQKVVRINRDNPIWTYPMVWERRDKSFSQVNKTEHGLAEYDGRGLVSLDFDHDGDRDLFIVPYEGPLRVYENVVKSRNSLAFEVVDERGSTAIGATVKVDAGENSSVFYQTDGNDFASQEPAIQHVGLGDNDTAVLVVTWPDGTERTFEVEANQRIRLTKNGIEIIDTYE